MNAEMRRTDRMLSESEAWQIVREGYYGMLATICEDGTPYAVPLNHVLIEDKIFFHCAPEGLKLRNLERSDKASYTVVSSAETSPNRFLTLYRSAVCFGTVREITDRAAKEKALRAICEKYTPGRDAQMERAVSAMRDRTNILEMRVAKITGKGSA